MNTNQTAAFNAGVEFAIMGYLKISWSISRGRDTEGYNICRLDDLATDRRYKCMGGGYDMTGSNLGQWLQAMYQERLVAIGNKASYICPDRNDAGLYGMHYYPATDKKSAHVNIDGGTASIPLLK